MFSGLRDHFPISQSLLLSWGNGLLHGPCFPLGGRRPDIKGYMIWCSWWGRIHSCLLFSWFSCVLFYSNILHTIPFTMQFFRSGWIGGQERRNDLRYADRIQAVPLRSEAFARRFMLGFHQFISRKSIGDPAVRRFLTQVENTKAINGHTFLTTAS